MERILNARGRVTFTEVWDAVSREFPNSLTQDSVSIRDALERYARPVGSPFWMMRTEVLARIRAHSELIALLAFIGKESGFDIWIGRPEQAATAEGLAGSVSLRSLVSSRPRKLEGVSNLQDVLLMDILWLNGDAVACAFEVESTTTMTSGLQRGSNLPASTPKIMVLPEERMTDFGRKMQSPLFHETFHNEKWSLLFFDTFRQEYSKSKNKTDIFSILGVLTPAATKRGSAKEVDQIWLGFSPSEE